MSGGLRLRRRSRALWGWLAVLLLWTPAAAAPDPQVAALVDRVSADSMQATVHRLVAFGTRFTGSDSNAAAARWLRARLTALGYKTVFDSFTVNVDRRFIGPAGNGSAIRHFVLQGVRQANVVAVKPGVLYPGREVVIGAHYDTIALDRAPDSQDVAPGANDNATGISGVLEAARLLKGVDLDATVVFTIFGSEELGLVGSRSYAAQARARGDDIVMMLQLDSIGGPPPGDAPDAFTLDTTAAHMATGEAVAQAGADYAGLKANNGTGGQVTASDGGCQCADHQSFLDQGYPAVGVFEFLDPATMNMSTDTENLLDFPMAARIARAALAAAVTAAGFPARSPDFNGDGRVSFADFLLFAPHFLKPMQAGDARFDLDRDGEVLFSDFVAFVANYGRTLH